MKQFQIWNWRKVFILRVLLFGDCVSDHARVRKEKRERKERKRRERRVCVFCFQKEMEYLLSGEGVHEAFVNTISEIIVDIQGAERLTAAKLAKATHITITEPNSLNLPLEVDLINGKELFIYFIPLMEGPHVLTLHYLKKQILKHEIPVSLKHPIQVSFFFSLSFFCFFFPLLMNCKEQRYRLRI